MRKSAPVQIFLPSGSPEKFHEFYRGIAQPIPVVPARERCDAVSAFASAPGKSTSAVVTRYLDIDSLFVLASSRIRSQSKREQEIEWLRALSFGFLRVLMMCYPRSLQAMLTAHGTGM